VQFKDGQTLSFDLFNSSDLDAWKRFSDSQGWRETVTAMGVHQHKVFNTLPAPNHGLTVSNFGAGLVHGESGKRIGERVWYEIGDFRISLVAYKHTKVTRLDVSKSCEVE
jgi:hypothetical protein